MASAMKKNCYEGDQLGNYFGLVGVGRPLGKVIFKLEEGEGPSWVSRETLQSQEERTDFVNAWLGQSWAYLRNRWKASAAGPQQAIGPLEKPDSFSSLQMFILERPVSDQLY